MIEEDARQLKSRSRMAFDTQASTYDEGMQGEHARRLYPYVVEEVVRAVAGKCLGAAAKLVAADAERLPFCDSSFDAAWCNDSFHHYPDPERAAFQAWRVLAPGGTLVIGDAWQPAPARAIMNAWMPYSREGDVRIYSERELKGILDRWFSEVSWRRIGATACIAVARKAV
ncbi:methyltransferase domain-containing protein [Collinsella tanakaei]|nr:methyltransferase domain-containing protein [Collinsella tanakaei]